jgi:hypothetical protein
MRVSGQCHAAVSSTVRPTPSNPTFWPQLTLPEPWLSLTAGSKNSKMRQEPIPARPAKLLRN